MPRSEAKPGQPFAVGLVVAFVAAGILPAVEPGFQPGGRNLTHNPAVWNNRASRPIHAFSGLQNAILYVRQDARRYGASRSRWGWWSRFQRLKAASLVTVKRNGSVGDSTWPSQKTTLALPWCLALAAAGS